MKIEILKPIKGFSYFAGDVVELEEDRAKNFIEAGVAIPAKGKGKPEGEAETADSKVKTEKAVKGKGKPEGEA